VTVELALSALRGGTVFIAFIRDITQQVNERQRQLELQRANEMLRLVLDNTGLAVATVGLDGSFLSVNERACELLAYTREEMLALNVAAIVAPAELEHVMGAFSTAAAGGAVSRFETSVVRRDGGLRRLAFGLTPLLEDGQLSAYIGAAEDITDQQAAQEALANSVRLDSLAALAGGVAHDFNNLLATILGNVAVIKTVPAGGSLQAEALGDIETAARHGAELARQMLAYAGKAQAVVEPLDLTELVTAIEPLLRAVLPRNVRTALDTVSLAHRVDADATQLRQVILNAVVNAAEALAGADGSVTLRTGVTELNPAAIVRCVGGQEAPAGTYAFLSIADDGPGMTAEVRARMFDPFFSTRFAGRGLGLSAVFGIVRGHRGVLDVASAPGAGTTLTVYLPVVGQAA
jgi:PAS domain S-box-containing protein